MEACILTKPGLSFVGVRFSSFDTSHHFRSPLSPEWGRDFCAIASGNPIWGNTYINETPQKLERQGFRLKKRLMWQMTEWADAKVTHLIGWQSFSWEGTGAMLTDEELSQVNEEGWHRVWRHWLKYKTFTLAWSQLTDLVHLWNACWSCWGGLCELRKVFMVVGLQGWKPAA